MLFHLLRKIPSHPLRFPLQGPHRRHRNHQHRSRCVGCCPTVWECQKPREQFCSMHKPPLARVVVPMLLQPDSTPQGQGWCFELVQPAEHAPSFAFLEHARPGTMKGWHRYNTSDAVHLRSMFTSILEAPTTINTSSFGNSDQCRQKLIRWVKVFSQENLR